MLTRCSRIGKKSFDLSYKIIKEENRKEILLADAITVMVYYEYGKKKSILMPEEWKRNFLQYEQF